MNPMSGKQAALQDVLKKYSLEPERIEVASGSQEIIFTFKANPKSCDNVAVQQDLCQIFDYAKSVAVVIPVEKTSQGPDLKLMDHITTADEERKNQIEAVKAKRLEVIQSENVAIAKQKPVATPSSPKGKVGKDGKARPSASGGALWGKPIRVPVESLATIDFSKQTQLVGQKLCIAGCVFGIDSRSVRGGRVSFNFNVTDGTGSVGCQLFDAEDRLQPLMDSLKKDAWVRIEGTLTLDNFRNQIFLKPRNIEPATAPIRTDDAKIKRVELHLHSQYSSMDAVSKVHKIMKQAEDFGHDAIGITDHGVVQAYPEMMNLSKKNGIKVLYGVEGYLVDDGVSIANGPQDEPFTGEFVFFDLETTGLAAGKDVIIEIAATKIKNKHIVETFSKIINPHRPIPFKITELTGITDQMVSGGEEAEDVIRDFLEFCDGRILVAHNAAFDMGFLRCALEDYGIEDTITYFDTLTMARALMKEIGKHNLKKLASYFKIDMGHHHRALDDAICSSKVMFKLMERAEKSGCHRVSELNALMNNEQILKTEQGRHVIIYAKNQDGIKDLYKIVSKAHVEYFYRKPKIPKSLLAANRKNLIIGSACEAGELYLAFKNGEKQARIDALADFYDYYEVQPLGNNDFLIREEGRTREELIEINQKIIALGKEKGKLVVATGDVHFVDPEDALYREVLQSGQGYRDADMQPPLYYRSTQEMLDEFDYLDPETAYEIVVTNTRKIADSMDAVLPIPDGTFPPVIEGSDDDIRNMVYDKAHEIYGDPLPEMVESRVKRELDSIIGNGYSVLYLIAQKLVHHSLEDGYLVGSRGSVGSSLVAMLCGITEVNSLAPHYICPHCKHYEFFDSTKVGYGPDLPDANCPECGTPMQKDGFDIPFETFLGFKGNKEPDIDLNFSGENQAEAHRYTEVLFGEGKVYRAGTIATLADKTAYGYVKNFYEEKGEYKPDAEISRVISGCEGVKRTTGQHPGGVMVVPRDKDIYDFTPIQHPADDRDSDTLTTHFDYHSIQGRMLKLDILGHDDPTMLRMLQDLTGVDPQSIPLDDENVLKLFRGTDSLGLVDDDFDIPLGTCGVPEFGTGFVRQMVLDAKPNAFADLVRISGLSHGTNVWLNNAQDLILNKVVSIKEVICTRDDIMLGLISMGLDSEESFKIMEHVRKGKGLTDEEEAYMRSFNVPEWYIDSCQKISYMFPKAHAVAYVMMAFRIAYYKVYHPLAYYATYFSIRAKEFNLRDMTSGKEHVKKTIAEIKALGNNASNKESNSLTSLELALEMYCRGFEFVKVDIYRSHYKNFLIEDGKLLPPLMAIDGLGEKVAVQIYEEARIKPFMSKEDLQNRAHVNKSNLEKLDSFGCLAGLPDSDQMSFFSFG